MNKNNKQPHNKKEQPHNYAAVNMRELALKLLYKVENKSAYANIVLNKALNKNFYQNYDKAFLTEIFYGTIKMQGAIDYILAQHLKKGQKGLDNLPINIRLILRLSTYQVIYLDKVPDSASVNEGVKLAKKYGHQGTVRLVNGVLRNIVRNKNNITWPAKDKNIASYISSYYSHPLWLVKYWLKLLGSEQTIALCKSNNQIPAFSIRTNTLKTNRVELLQILDQKKIEATEGPWAKESIYLNRANLNNLSCLTNNLYTVQGESSMLAAHILDPQPKSTVIDMCAAPGGKTTHLAQLMKNQGQIKAFDIHKHKVNLIQKNCQRLDINIVDSQVADAQHLSAKLNAWADFVLLDAPCSGLGVLDQKADARWQKSLQDIKNLAALGKNLLAEAAQILKPGGFLLYSTCTITKEENQDQIAAFLKDYPNFKLTSFAKALPKSASDTDKLAAQKGMWQMLPFEQKCQGFFFAYLKKLS